MATGHRLAQYPGEVIAGLEACGYSEWFEDLLFELQIETRIGNAAEIRKRARFRQKTDHCDAELILDLPLKNQFPRINGSSVRNGLTWWIIRRRPTG